jgi:hypothetical protein
MHKLYYVPTELLDEQDFGQHWQESDFQPYNEKIVLFRPAAIHERLHERCMSMINTIVVKTSDVFEVEKKQFKVTQEMMQYLGFDMLSHNEPYAKYQNNGTVHWNRDYNPDFPESRGRVIVYVNNSYNNTGAFLEIQQDGGTRKVFHGSVDSFETLVRVLYSIR